MTEKILPLPVKKNKFGQRVADISVDDYYRQIMEEVLEAHAEDLLWTAAINDIEDAQAEELADVITCCITRFDVRHQYDDEPFDVESVVVDALKRYRDNYQGNFYVELAAKVLYAFNAAKTAEFVEELLFGSESGCNRCVIEFELDADEETLLADIIALCVKRLDFLGYDEDVRQKLYQDVNDKNKLRGYFED